MFDIAPSSPLPISRSRLQRHIVLVFAMLAALPLGASTMLVSNFGPGNAYNTNTGDYWVIPSTPQTGDPIGFIDPSNTYYSLLQIQVGTDLVTGTTTSGTYTEVNVGFWESTSNNLGSATQVESWNLVTPAMQPGEMFTLSSASEPVIQPGDYYFITEDVIPNPVPASALAVWSWNWGTVENESTGAESAPQFGPLFSVTVADDAPEPGTTLLMAAGFATILALYVRRRRNPHRPAHLGIH